MDRPASRPDREARKKLYRERKKAQAKLRREQAREGLAPPSRTGETNGTCPYQTVAEEQTARTDAVLAQAQVIRGRLPDLLWRFKRIPDPRCPRKLRHKQTVLLIYGVLMFVYQLASRRDANRTMTRPAFEAQLRELFPELEKLPHGDTLYRLLDRLDVAHLEEAHLALVRRLIRGKKFARYLVAGHYPIAIDGTQKYAGNELRSEECLERTVGSGEKARPQYYVYVLEASLAFPNGMTIPLLSEFLSNADFAPGVTKQDCEQKAFPRLARRLKEAFPQLPILLLLDGLYPNGPVLACCRDNHWQFMIVLQDKSLPSVWADYQGLLRVEREQWVRHQWGNRRQCFRWVNDLEYIPDKSRRKFRLHVVVCHEQWQEIDPATNQPMIKQSKHAWISSEPLDRRNVVERCNQGARHRWGIETGFLIEKRHGYHYEHCFAESWNAMKGYHFLMHLARLLNVLCEFSERVGQMVRQMGQREFFRFVRETIGGRWLNPQEVQRRLARPEQLRLL